MAHRRSGFTFVEMLIVITIISVLVSLLLPSIQKAQELARRGVCASNLRQIGTGYAEYVQDNHGWTPYNLAGRPYEMYILYHKNSGWYNDGILYRDEYVNTGRVYFCPSKRKRNIESGYEYNWWVIHDDPAAVMGWSDGDFYSRSNYTPWFSRKPGGGYGRLYAMDANTALNCDNLNWPLSVGHNGATQTTRDDPAAYNVLYADGAVSFWIDTDRISWNEMTAFWQVEMVYEWFDQER